jgi:hypothetical protein
LEVGELLRLAGCGHHTISRFEHCLCKCAAETARTAGDKPNLRHRILSG